MPAIVTDDLRNNIYKLNYLTLDNAYKMLQIFWASETYQTLANTDFAELDDHDKVCFTLTRKATETKKIDIGQLKEAITRIYKKLIRESTSDIKEAEIKAFDAELNLFADFDFFCSIMEGNESLYPDLDECVFLGLNAAVAILKVMNFSQKQFPTDSGLRYFRRNALWNPVCGFINLAGLDLQQANLSSANLNDADLTETNLSQANLDCANLDRALLLGTELSEVSLNYASLRGTNLKLARLEHIKPNPSFISFLTEKFDVMSLNQQLHHLKEQQLDQIKHVSLFKAITDNIGFAIRNMKVSNNEKRKLIEAAINHELFGDQQSHTVTNWINFGVRFFVSGQDKNIPTFSVSKAQKDLIFIRQWLEVSFEKKQKNASQFFSSSFDEDFVFLGKKEKQPATDPLTVFINRYGSCYDILKVDSTATIPAIEKQFRKLSLIWHPDKNKTLEAPEEFHKINTAKEILMDETKRRYHDQLITEEEKPIRQGNLFK